MNTIGNQLKDRIKNVFGIEIIVKSDFPFEILEYKDKHITISKDIISDMITSTKYTVNGYVWDYESDVIIRVCKELGIKI